MSKVEEILGAIEVMTVLELSELVKACEEKFDVKASAPMMGMMPMAGAGAGAAEEKEEQTSFNVVLTSAGSNKIAVIKEIRAVTSLGLKEAKDLVDGAPKTVKENASKEEAEEVKKKLEGAGGSVELK